MRLSSTAVVAVVDVGDGCDVHCVQPLWFVNVFVQSGAEKSHSALKKQQLMHKICKLQHFAWSGS